MSSEAELVISIWEAVKNHLPHSKRADIAKDIMYAFVEYGFDAGDLESIVDEDPDLAEAYEEVLPELEMEDEEYRDDD